MRAAALPYMCSYSHKWITCIHSFPFLDYIHESCNSLHVDHEYILLVVYLLGWCHEPWRAGPQNEAD